MTNQTKWPNEAILYCRPGRVKIPIRFDIFKHGGGIYLAAVNASERVHLPFVASASTMIAELRRVADAIERAVAVNDQACITPTAAVASAAPEEARKPAATRLTAEDLRGLDDETAYTLLIERFRNSDAKIYTDLLADYRKATGRNYKGTSDADLDFDDRPAATLATPVAAPRPALTQTERDFETIRAHLPTLIQNGQLVRGIQTRIADLLYITNAGPTNRQRILKIVSALEAHLSKLDSSASSIADEAAIEFKSDAIRAA